MTDEVTKAWSGMTTRQYKNYKGLKKENLRDNMSTLELALNMLAEATTTELTNAQNPHGLEENRAVAKQGGKDRIPNRAVCCYFRKCADDAAWKCSGRND